MLFGFLFLIIFGIAGLAITNSGKNYSGQINTVVDQGIDIGNQVYDTADTVVKNTFTKTNQVGDTIILKLAPSQVKEQQVGIITSSDSETINSADKNSTLTVNQQDSFGHNSVDVILPENTYIIGNPFEISFKLKKVIPNSCRIVQNDEVCDYVTPAKFDFVMEISCRHRAFCSIDPITINNQQTNNFGEFKYMLYTNSRFTEGDYMITVDANSISIDPDTQRPYEIHISQMVRLVDL